jgi:hypothetical protein
MVILIRQIKSGRAPFLVPAYTLVESLVALIIIVTITGFGLLLYLRVLQGDAYLLRFRAKQQVNLLLIETISKELYFDDEIEFPEFSINKRVDFYKGDKKVALIRLQATGNNGRKLYTRRILRKIE